MRIIITGASSGIGEAVAHAFASRGEDLYLVARRQDRLQGVGRECLRLGARSAATAAVDLSEEGAGREVVLRGMEALSGLDVLICNAGYGCYGPVQEISPQQMSRLWQVNYQSGYESIHAALPHLLEQRSGHIVLVSSVLGKTPLPMSSVYCATKFAQVGLGESLWGELRGSGVGVSVVCPGFTKTEFASSAYRAPTMADFGRVGGDSPETVAQVILKAVDRKKRLVVLTWPGRVFYTLNRLLPSRMARLTAWFIGRHRKR